MVLFLLDTTTLTHLRHNHPSVTNAYALDTLPVSGHVVGVASINVEEVVGGWMKLLQRVRTPEEEADASQLLTDSIQFLAQFPLFPATEASIKRYDVLRKMRLNVGRNDLRLAALGLELNATVVTNNFRDFGRVSGLKVVDWT